jgi:site-specific DNA-cytosine methylase
MTFVPAVTSKWAKGTGGPAGDVMPHVAVPQAVATFRKSRRAQSVDDHETWVEDDATNTLNTHDVGDVRATDVVVEPVAFSENQRGETVLSNYAHAVTSGGGKPGQGYPAAMTTYGVRRLTPTECERLQGFPDGWTDPAGSDSARYRTLGNAVTVNVPQWLFRRMKELG